MKTVILFTIFSFSLISNLQAKEFKLSQKNQILFTAKGFPTFMKITGESQSLEGHVTDQEKAGMDSLEITFPLNSLKTGMDLRDDHMKNNYLEVTKYPNAALKIMAFDLEDSVAKGRLNLHGVEKEVMLNFTATQKDDALTVESDFDLVLSDYGISIPSFQGITVAKDIKISVKFTAMGAMK